jgi:hypothetical protein
MEKYGPKNDDCGEEDDHPASAQNASHSAGGFSLLLFTVYCRASSLFATGWWLQQSKVFVEDPVEPRLLLLICCEEGRDEVLQLLGPAFAADFFEQRDQPEMAAYSHRKSAAFEKIEEAGKGQRQHISTRPLRRRELRSHGVGCRFSRSTSSRVFSNDE